jgi:hypothetical protein
MLVKSSQGLQVVLDINTGLVKTLVQNGEEIPLGQNFYYYEGFNGDNEEFEHRSSGAYIFRPTEQEPKQVAASAETTVYKGKTKSLFNCCEVSNINYGHSFRAQHINKIDPSQKTPFIKLHNAWVSLHINLDKMQPEISCFHSSVLIMYIRT